MNIKRKEITLISERKRKYLIPIGYMLIILISSSVPMDKEIEGLEFLMKIKPGLQNFLHIPVFALMSYLWVRGFYLLGYSVGRGLFLSLLLTITFAVLNEFFQVLIPGRYCSLGDMLFNFLGLILGALFGAFLLYGRKKRSLVVGP